MVRLSIPVPKLEQAQANDSPDFAVGVQFRRPNGTGLTVGKVETVSVGSDTAGLGQSRIGKLAVGNGLAAGTGVRPNRIVNQVHHPKLVATRHSDIQTTLVVYQIPGRVQLGTEGRPGAAAPIALVAVSGDGSHRPLSQVNLTNGVAFGIRDVKRLSNQGHALGMVQSGRGKVPVLQPLGAGANNLSYRSVQGSNYNPVVVGVGDKQPVAFRVGQHLAGERQGSLRLLLSRVGNRVTIQQTLAVKLLHHPAHQAVKLLVGKLALVLADNPTFRVNKHQGRPGPAGILLPDLELGIIDYRMFQFVPLDRLVEVLLFLFVRELG